MIIRDKNYFLCDIMEHCSRQCIRRTLYAVMIGISPILLCLLLIAIARLIVHRLELAYYRRHEPIDRRRSSSVFYHSGRPTLSYTPVSMTELQRIIQGEYQSQQQSESSLTNLNNDNSSPKTHKFLNSILPRHEPMLPSNALANLVIRRNAIDSTPMTALFAPISTSNAPTFDIINEQKTQRPSVMTITHESIETTTLATNNNNYFFDANDSESEQTETDQLLTSPKTTTTTTVVVEEFVDFHSARSIPYSLNLINSILENDF
jgi:hypothetical protein